MLVAMIIIFKMINQSCELHLHVITKCRSKEICPPVPKYAHQCDAHQFPRHLCKRTMLHTKIPLSKCYTEVLMNNVTVIFLICNMSNAVFVGEEVI